MTRVVGVALAGGASRRMGRDKARLRVGGETLVASAVRRLGAAAGEVVVADRGRGVAPPGVVAVADGPGAGPAAGVLGAARAFPGAELLVLGCDLPAVPAALLAALRELPGDWVVPWPEGRPQPLAALYRAAALAALARRVAAGVLDLRGLAAAEGLAVTAVGDHELAAFGAPRHLFVNLNRPEDLREFLAGQGPERPRGRPDPAP